MSASPSSVSRRRFLGTLGLTAAATATGSVPRHPLPTRACNTYPWITFLRREDQNFADRLAASLSAIAQIGFDSLEPLVDSPQSVDLYQPLLERHDLRMESVYMNCVLHEEKTAEANIDQVVATAVHARARLHTRILVTNPRPLRWGGSENKTDAQIHIQGRALDRLGAALRNEGITLAYHNHDSELRAGAREFHHMLVATDPANVKFCLDAHWVFRGCGDSAVALFDVLELYTDRIVELHLRQSTDGVWDETFTTQGDIDYSHLLLFLHHRGIRPLLTMEQAVEAQSPHAHDAVSAHRESYSGLLELIQSV